MRTAFTAELDQLRLQVELMGVRVGENLERMQRVLLDGDAATAAEALGADDAIDAMLVSLTQRCYDILRRESPVASDLRFVVSVLRVLEEFERIGDLGLRVVKSAPEHARFAEQPALLGALQDMGATAGRLFASAASAWSGQDLRLACTLTEGAGEMDGHYDRLLREILALDGPGAAPVAVAAVLVGRALERIADHTVIVGERLRYLITGDPAHLAAEVR